MYNQLTFIFSKEQHGTILSTHLTISFVNEKNEKKKTGNGTLLMKIMSLYLLLLRYYFSNQLIFILYTYSLNMQATKT